MSESMDCLLCDHIASSHGMCFVKGGRWRTEPVCTDCIRPPEVFRSGRKPCPGYVNEAIYEAVLGLRRERAAKRHELPCTAPECVSLSLAEEDSG